MGTVDKKFNVAGEGIYIRVMKLESDAAPRLDMIAILGSATIERVQKYYDALGKALDFAKAEKKRLGRYEYAIQSRAGKGRGKDPKPPKRDKGRGKKRTAKARRAADAPQQGRKVHPAQDRGG